MLAATLTTGHIHQRHVDGSQPLSSQQSLSHLNKHGQEVTIAEIVMGFCTVNIVFPCYPSTWVSGSSEHITHNIIPLRAMNIVSHLQSC